MTFRKLALTTILAGGVALPAYAQGLGGSADAGVGGEVGTDGGSVGADVGADVGVGDTGADVGVGADVGADVGTDGASADAGAGASADAGTGDSDDSDGADSGSDDSGSDDSDSSDAADSSDSSDSDSTADSADSSDNDTTASVGSTASTGTSGQGNTNVPQEMKLLLERPTAVISADGVLIGTVSDTRTDPTDGSTQAVVEVNDQTGLSPESLAFEVADLTVQADGTLAFGMTLDGLRDHLESN